MVLMFGPVLWVAMSSFKTDAALSEYPPSFLPWPPRRWWSTATTSRCRSTEITGGEHQGEVLAQVRRIGLNAQMVDPANPGQKINVKIGDREPKRTLRHRLGQLHPALRALQLHALFLEQRLHHGGRHRHHPRLSTRWRPSRWRNTSSKRRTVVCLLIIATLMIPPTVVLVPLFLVVRDFGHDQHASGR